MPRPAGCRDGWRLFFESEVRQAFDLGALVARSDEVAGDVDPEYVSAETGGRDRRRTVTTSEVEDLHTGSYAELVDEVRAHSTRHDRRLGLAATRAGRLPS